MNQGRPSQFPSRKRDRVRITLNENAKVTLLGIGMEPLIYENIHVNLEVRQVGNTMQSKIILSCEGGQFCEEWGLAQAELGWSCYSVEGGVECEADIEPENGEDEEPIPA